MRLLLIAIFHQHVACIFIVYLRTQQAEHGKCSTQDYHLFQKV